MERYESRVLEAESNTFLKCEKKIIPIENPLNCNYFALFPRYVDGIPMESLMDYGCKQIVICIGLL